MSDRDGYAPHLELDDEDFDHMDWLAGLGETGMNRLVSGIRRLTEEGEERDEGIETSAPNYTELLRADIKKQYPNLSAEGVEALLDLY